MTNVKFRADVAVSAAQSAALAAQHAQATADSANALMTKNQHRCAQRENRPHAQTIGL
jgi:hypothetical protein